MDRLIADYLLRVGAIDAANSLIDSAGIDDFIDTKVFADGKKVMQSLHDGKVALPLAWCAVHRGHLKKIDVRRRDYCGCECVYVGRRRLVRVRE